MHDIMGFLLLQTNLVSVVEWNGSCATIVHYKMLSQ